MHLSDVSTGDPRDLIPASRQPVPDPLPASVAATDSSLFFDLFWHSPEALLLANPDGITLDLANPAYCRMHGYEPGELDGRPVASLYPPNSHADLRAHILRATQLGEHAWETWHQRKDGTAFPVWMKVRVVYDAQGQVRLRIASAQDISQRKRFEDEARQTENLLQAISENSTAGINVKDRDGRYLFSNPLSDSALGVPPGGALGKTDYDLFPTDYAEVFRTNDLAVLESGIARETEELVPSPDGDTANDRTFLCLKFPLYNASGTAYATGLIGTEITERKRMQEHLEDLTIRLRRAMQETHHRVKNNLQVIAALAEMQIDPDVPHLPLQAMHRIVQHIHTLAGLHDLLTLHAKFDENEGVVSAQELFKKLLPLLRSALEGRHIHTQMADIRFTSRMASAFAILVNELVSNAVKHGKGDIEIHLVTESVNAAKEVEKEVKQGETARANAVFTVSDDGPGFPTDFDPQRYANTGLELIDSVVRYDLHGTITYTNREPHGAEIRVIFPLLAPALEG